MDKTLALQLQIRQNSEEISSALTELSSWEKNISIKDKKVTSKPKPIRETLPRSGGGTVPIRNETTPEPVSAKPELTPASLVDTSVSSIPNQNIAEVPKALGIYEKRDPEEVERERGNAEFKAGNFALAVKSYTKCMGLKSQNYIAFSNRAMAYLKLKEFNKAVMDCNSALLIQPDHVKTLLRRATALNSLGKHRGALLDLYKILELEPGNKQARIDLLQSKEAMRNAISRAPFSLAPKLEDFLSNHGINLIDSLFVAPSEVTQGPDLLLDPIEIKEAINNSLTELQDLNNIEIKVEKDEEDPIDQFHRIAIVSVEESSNTLETKKKSTKSDGNAKKKTSSSSKSKSLVSEIKGAYELEKSLVQYQNDLESLEKLLKSLKASNCKSLFSQAFEPEVLYLLISSLYRVYWEGKGKFDPVFEWLNALVNMSTFSLLYTLMPSDQKLTIQSYVQTIISIKLEAKESSVDEIINLIQNKFEIKI